MEGKTIRNIQSTQQNLLASRHFPPFQCCLFPVQALKHLLSFYANDHWAASSHLITGNIYCFSQWGLSFLHTPINEQIRMYSLTIIHFLSKLGLCFLHTHTHTHTHTRMHVPLTHTHMHACTHICTRTALPKQSSEKVEPGAVVVVPSGQATHWVWRGSAMSLPSAHSSQLLPALS